MISIYIPVFNKRFYDLQNGSIFLQKVSDLMPTDSKFIFQDCFVGRKNGWFYLVAWSSQLNQYTMAFGVKWFSKLQ